MKKIIITFTIMMIMALTVNAQDGFFREDDSGYRGTPGVDEPLVPHGLTGSIPDQDAAPLGSGLLIMTILGGTFVLRKKLKDN